MNKLLEVKCPRCEIVFRYYESEFRPFCCERCKMIDLGHWFEESYRVPAKEKNQNDTNIESESQSSEQNLEDYEDDENNY